MMPFITEELWQQIPHEGEALIVAPWPETDESRFDETAEREVDLIQRIVGTVRNIRGGFRVPPSRKADVLIKTMAKEVEEIVESNREIITDLARADNLEVGARPSQTPIFGNRGPEGGRDLRPAGRVDRSSPWNGLGSRRRWIG